MPPFTVRIKSDHWRLAKMNLAIRRIDSSLGNGHEDTFNDQFPDLRADYTIVNPVQHQGLGLPVHSKTTHVGWQGFHQRATPTRSDSALSAPPRTAGMAGIVMSNSLSTTKKQEEHIRKGIINDDKLDCVIMLPDKLFTNTGISACI